MFYKVFGGSGFIGNHLIKKLAGEGHKVTVLDIKKPKIKGANVYRPDGGEASWYNPISFVPCDITDYQSVYYGIDRGDFVINLGALSKFDECESDLARAISVNVSGLANIAQSCIQNEAAHLVQASSGAVYSIFCEGRIKEDALVSPASFYGFTKAMGDNLLNYIKDRLKYCILRLPYVYGPGKTWGANSIIEALIKKERPVIYGDGLAGGDFTFVDDVVQAIQLVSHKQSEGVLNMGSDESSTVNDFFEMSMRYLELRNINPIFKPSLGYQRKEFMHDITRLKELGYKPAFNLEKGLDKTIREWEQWL